MAEVLLTKSNPESPSHKALKKLREEAKGKKFSALTQKEKDDLLLALALHAGLIEEE